MPRGRPPKVIKGKKSTIKELQKNRFKAKTKPKTSKESKENTKKRRAHAKKHNSTHPRELKYNTFHREDTDIPEVTIKAGNYDPKTYPIIAHNLCAQHGLTNAQLAHVFGISIKTIEGWITRYEDFRTLVRSGKDKFDTNRVENALLKRALGFEYEEVETKTIQLKGKRDDTIVFVPAKETKITKKVLAPETKAAIFWLTNRDKERWQMVQKIDVNKNINERKQITETKVDLNQMPVDKLKALKELIMASGMSDGKVIPVECEMPDDLTKQLEYFDKAAKSVIEAEIEEETEE